MRESDSQSTPFEEPYDLANPLVEQDRPGGAATGAAVLEREPTTVGTTARDPYAALRLPGFQLFASARFLSAAGAQVQTAAVGWEIYSKSRNALDLGWLGLVLAVPTLLLSLPAGQLADTVSRKKLFLFMQLSTTCCAAGLAIVSWRLGASAYQIGMMYALLGAAAVGGAVGRPGRDALLAQIVPADLYPNAVMWNSTSFELSSMGGPAVGGLIVWLAGPAVAYAVAAVALGIGLALTCRLPDPPRDRPASDATDAVPRGDRAPRRHRAAGLADLATGLRFVFRTKLILAALTLDLFAVLFGGAAFLLPLFAKDVLGVGALGFGCLRAAPSVGAVAAAMIQAHRRPFARAGRALLFAVAGFGAATIVFGLSRSYALSFAMLVLTGATDNVSVVIRRSLVPLLTPDPMRGRVMAVNQVFVGSSNELGGLESGLTAYWLGPVASAVGGGLLSILVVLAVAARFPQVRQLGSLEDLRPADDAEDDDPATAGPLCPAALTLPPRLRPTIDGHAGA